MIPVDDETVVMQILVATQAEKVRAWRDTAPVGARAWSRVHAAPLTERCADRVRSMLEELYVLVVRARAPDDPDPPRCKIVVVDLGNRVCQVEFSLFMRRLA